MENFFTIIFNLNEFVFVYVVNIRFICDGETYLFIKKCPLPTDTITLYNHDFEGVVRIIFAMLADIRSTCSYFVERV